MPRPVIRPYAASVEFIPGPSQLVKTTPTGLNTGTLALSFVSWIYPKGSTLQIVADLLGGAMGRRFSIGGSAGIYYYFSDGVNAVNNMTLTTAEYFGAFKPDSWARVVWTVSQTQASLYVNGALVKTRSLGMSMNSEAYTKLVIGASGVPSLGFTGWGNDAYFANKEMDLADVQADYFNAKEPSDIASAWMMGEGAGTNIVDRIGTNHLTASSFNWSARTPSVKRAPVNGNLLKNGDFEFAPPFTAATTTSSRFIDGTAAGSTTNSLFGYFMVIGGSVTGSAQFDTSVKRSGSSSLKISCTVANAGSTVGMYVGLTNQSGPSVINQAAYMIPVTPNTTYVLSGYIKTNNLVTNDATGAKFQTAEYTGASTINSGSNSSAYLSGTNDWTLRTITFTTSSTSRWLNVQAYIIGDSTGEAWFDDISLLPVYPNNRDQVGGNLVKNFDFEVVPTFVATTTTSGRWIDGTAAGSATNATYKWAIASAALTASASASFDTTVFRSGLASLKLDRTDATGAVVVANVLNAASGGSLGTIPIEPGVSYTFNIYAKTSTVGSNTVYADVREFNVGAGIVATNSTNKLSGTNDWTLLTVTFTADAATRNCCIILRNAASATIGPAWFDDISLTKTTPDTRASAGTRTAA